MVVSRSQSAVECDDCSPESLAELDADSENLVERARSLLIELEDLEHGRSIATDFDFVSGD